MNTFAPRNNTLNAEGYCRQCGEPLGISGQCAHCALEEMDKRSREFLKTRTLTWWRDYWRNACRVLADQLDRPLTMQDKTVLLRHWRTQHRLTWPILSTPSYTALAMVCYVMEFEDNDDE